MTEVQEFIAEPPARGLAFTPTDRPFRAGDYEFYRTLEGPIVRKLVDDTGPPTEVVPDDELSVMSDRTTGFAEWRMKRQGR